MVAELAVDARQGVVGVAELPRHLVHRDRGAADLVRGRTERGSNRAERVIHRPQRSRRSQEGVPESAEVAFLHPRFEGPDRRGDDEEQAEVPAGETEDGDYLFIDDEDDDYPTPERASA